MALLGFAGLEALRATAPPLTLRLLTGVLMTRVAQVYGRGGSCFGAPPHTTWTGRAPNPRGKKYLDSLRPHSRSKVKSSTALQLGRRTMSE